MSADDARLARVRELLRSQGLPFADVSTAGANRDIAVLEGVDGSRLASLAPAIRSIGFRFVALDLSSREG